MANTTYQDLYTLVQKEILKGQAFPTGKLTGSAAMGRQQVTNPVDTTTAQAIVDVANITNLIMDLMLHTVPPQIKSGLTVRATYPETNQVTVEAGEGTVGGKIFTLVEDTTYVIPLVDDDQTPVWYMNFGTDGINMSRTPIFGKLTIAKIVVPVPGKSAHIRDQKDIEEHPWDAWIVNMKEIKLWGDGQGRFEEDSIAYLKNNIGDILADQLIGNIRLNEDLKITNTQGSVEIDSKAVKIYDTEENRVAEFNRYGTFFYDADGIELAKFSVDGAHVGNIEVNKNNIQSKNFTSNLKGFQITDSGYAEFEDARIRGVLKATVFEKETVSAVGGQLIVANAATLVDDVASTDTIISVDNSVFALNEVVIIKDGGSEEYMEITDISNAPIYGVTRDLKGVGASDWNKGTTIVSTGTVGEGYLVLDASSDYSPFMDIIARDGTLYDDVNLKVRLGNLAGVNDPEFGQLSGYGLYSDNAYLKGNLFALGIKTAISGSRIDMDTERFFAYDDDENLLFQIFMDDVSGTPGQGGGEVGDMYFGDYYNQQGLWWDKSEAKLWIRGFLDASDVTIGRMSVSFLSGGIVGESGDPVDIEYDSNSGQRSANYPYSGATWGWYFIGDGTSQQTLSSNVLHSGLDTSFIESENYVANTTGWRFEGDGDFWVNMNSASYIEVATGGYIQSDNWVSGVSGWRLDGDGTLDIRLEDLTDVLAESSHPNVYDVPVWNGSEYYIRPPRAVYA